MTAQKRSSVICEILALAFVPEKLAGSDAFHVDYTVLFSVGVLADDGVRNVAKMHADDVNLFFCDVFVLPHGVDQAMMGLIDVRLNVFHEFRVQCLLGERIF